MVMKGCSGWHKQPLSTLSASIEHPLEPGGNLVESGARAGWFYKVHLLDAERRRYMSGTRS